VDDSHLRVLEHLAADFRDAIERARAERLPGALPYFPDGACRMTSRLFAQHLAGRPDSVFGRPQLVSGVLPGSESLARHFWLEVDGIVIDLTADPFGEAAVVVGSRTPFHHSLTSLVADDAAQVLAALSAEELARLARQLAAIESRLPPQLNLGVRPHTQF
jgi:hypothetical protein